MCPKCKAEIREVSQNFCAECGHDLRALQTTCAECGHGVHMHIHPEAGSLNYCCMCGAEWKNAFPPKAA